MNDYDKACTTCKKQIRMSNYTGKWLPSNLDGSAHRCFGKSNLTTTKDKEDKKDKDSNPQLKNVIEAQLFLEVTDARLKRIEKMLFIDG